MSHNPQDDKSLNEIRFAGWTDNDYINNDYIRELRAYLDAYNAGTVEDQYLDKYKDVVKGKFVIANVEEALLGGLWIHILFIDKPTLMFSKWVYSNVDETTEKVTDYEVRGWVTDKPTECDFTKEEVLGLMKEHPDLIAW